MGWEARFIEFLQKGSNSITDGIMLFFTQFGSEIFFLVILVALYWCVNKRAAYKFFNVYLLSTAVNTLFKVVIKRTRPYAKYSSTIKSIGSETGGYSFPSGHSQSIANISTQGFLNCKNNRKLVLIVGAVLTAIVMLSRIYLGQHYLTDVIVGLAVGILLAIGFSYLFELLKDKEEWLFLGIAPLCVIVLAVMLITNVYNQDPEVLKVLGAYLAFSVGYFLEKRYIKFDPRYEKSSKRIWKTVLKILIGLGVGLGLKEGLKFIFPQEIPLLFDFLRYFIVAAWATLGATSIFKALKL